MDNKDDDDDDDDDDSHPAPCNNRGSSVATLASPGISQMRLLCLTDKTSHTAQRRFCRVYSASQTTTQPLMCDNHTRKLKYSLLHGLHLFCFYVMPQSYKKQTFFMHSTHNHVISWMPTTNKSKTHSQGSASKTYSKNV